MKYIEYADILENTEIENTIYRMTLVCPKIAKEAKAGQFVELYTGIGECLLPRPISINEIDAKNGRITIIYQTVGKGTQYFSTLKNNLKIMGSCGNGFSIDQNIKKSIVVGGGIGIPPLVELCKNIKGDIEIFLGAKTKPILIEKLSEFGKVYVSSDDGSYGFKGNVVELIESVKPEGEIIYSCGPKIMLRELSKWAEKNKIKAQVSLEERMACGIGACVGCAVKVKKDGDWQNLKVCKDGPVFMSDEVIWDD